MTDRNALLQKLADHYEERARELDQLARWARSRKLVVEASAISFKAQALAFREAAAYAHQQKEQ